MKTPLITRQGYENLRQELDHLWRVERPEITRKVTWAASLGDRSENADYQYNKKRLREIDRRVRYLRKCQEYLKVMYFRPEQERRVIYGSWVEISNDDDSFDRKDYISIDSPMARALVKKEVDDEAQVTTEAGTTVWYINSIEYEKS